MDILTHCLSGVAFATVLAARCPRRPKQQLAIVAAGGLGGFLPDIDALSLWSRFDATIGRALGLEHAGRVIYSEKFWYSHHGFMHSLPACLLFAALLGILLYLFQTRFKHLKGAALVQSFAKNKLLLGAFAAGFCLHLLGDLPTPSASWGGIALLWPSSHYVGGTGDIWWWNNYDVFLILCSVIALNTVLLLLARPLKRWLTKAVFAVFILGFCGALFQIKTRPVSFAYEGSTAHYAQFEQTSKAVQQQLLGDRVYRLMEAFDNKLPIYF